jgi:hypothetical protein
MSIEQTDVVDIISTDRMTGHVVLTISDHLDWSDSVESGEILQNYPHARDRQVEFRVVFRFQPDEAGRAFLSKVAPIIESAGLSFRYDVFTGGRFN